MNKILVEIATYHDPDLLNTVNSAIKQADHPERVFFSICYQGDDTNDYEALEKIQGCKLKHLKEPEIKGLCYARSLCQQMIEDEDFIYQIDSHMRFVKHWDTKMIEQLLSFNDPKAMISYYPFDFTDIMESLPVEDEIFDLPTVPTINFAKEFYNDSYFVKLDSNYAREDQKNRLGSPLIAGGNFFSFANIQKEVLYDPKMCWLGDELPMAIRYFTNGWNNYCPEQSYVYHHYCRKNRAVHGSYAEGKEREEQRFKRLLNLDCQNHDFGKYGLGKKRTLAQFESCTGIDFFAKTVGEPTSCYFIPK